MLNRSTSLAMSTSILKASPGKLDIKRHSPSIPYLSVPMVAIVSGSLEEFKSVLVGGACQGWLPDVSVVLWRRMLGALGDVNKIDDPAIHASVFEHLCDLQDTLQRVGLAFVKCVPLL